MNDFQVPSRSSQRSPWSASLGDLGPGVEKVGTGGGEGQRRNREVEIGAPRKRREARRRDATLIERVKQGDHTAFFALLDAHQETVYRLAWNMTGHAQDAMEVTQDAFLTVYRQIGTFDGCGDFDTRLYRIAVKRAIMTLRGRPRAPGLPIKEAGPAFQANGQHARPGMDWSGLPENARASIDERRVLAEAMEALPAEDKAVVVLRDIEGLSDHETAEVLGTSVAEVKTRLHRARLALCERLAASFETDAKTRQAPAPPASVSAEP